MSFDNDTNTQEFEGYIYQISNKNNNKIYIGQTRCALNVRWSQHKYDTKYSDHKPLYRAMKKYGFDSFEMTELEKIKGDSLDELTKELNQKEKYYISLYNTISPNGYNLTFGGEQSAFRFLKKVDAYNASGKVIYSFDSIADAIAFLKPNGEQHHGISECCKGKAQSALGYIWRYHEDSFDKYPVTVTQKQLDRYNNLIPVEKYSLEGKFLGTFESITEALLSVNRKSGGTSIKHCCEGEYNKAYGFVWRYKGESFEKYSPHHNDLSPVDVYTKDGRLVGSYTSINDALRKLNISETNRTSICCCCKGSNKTCANYVWRYKGDSFDKYSVTRKPKEHKKICKYSITGTFLGEYPSALQCAKSIGMTSGSHILNACKGYTKGHIAYGYMWYFLDDSNQPMSK